MLRFIEGSECLVAVQELLDHHNIDSTFLTSMNRGDETWVYDYELGSKRRSMEWNGTN